MKVYTFRKVTYSSSKLKRKSAQTKQSTKVPSAELRWASWGSQRILPLGAADSGMDDGRWPFSLGTGMNPHTVLVLQLTELSYGLVWPAIHLVWPSYQFPSLSLPPPSTLPPSPLPCLFVSAWGHGVPSCLLGSPTKLLELLFPALPSHLNTQQRSESWKNILLWKVHALVPNSLRAQHLNIW